MKATVISQSHPLGMCSARTDTDVLAVFRMPAGVSIDLGDVLELDLLALDRQQEITNTTKGQRLSIEVRSHDVHDLRLPAGHGTSRFPTPERRADPAASATPVLRTGVAHRNRSAEDKMKNKCYSLPDTAPRWMRSWLRDSPSRNSLRTLMGLSFITALVVAWVERMGVTVFISLVFLWPGILIWFILRWCDSHGVFNAQAPDQPSQPMPLKRHGSP